VTHSIDLCGGFLVPHGFTSGGLARLPECEPIRRPSCPVWYLPRKLKKAWLKRALGWRLGRVEILRLARVDARNCRKRGFESHADFLRAVMSTDRGRIDPRLRPMQES
jgi:hypothetical protein